MPPKIFGSLKLPKGITARHAGGVAVGAGIASAISFGVDVVLQKGIQVSPGPLQLVKMDIIKYEPKRITRSAIAGLWGTIPVEIGAGALYFASKENKDIALGMAAGGIGSFFGWLIRGIVYDQMGKDPQWKIKSSFPKAGFKTLKFGRIREGVI
jgi:hypothetical protein